MNRPRKEERMTLVERLKNWYYQRYYGIGAISPNDIYGSWSRGFYPPVIYKEPCSGGNREHGECEQRRNYSPSVYHNEGSMSSRPPVHINYYRPERSKHNERDHE